MDGVRLVLQAVGFLGSVVFVFAGLLRARGALIVLAAGETFAGSLQLLHGPSSRLPFLAATNT